MSPKFEASINLPVNSSRCAANAVNLFLMTHSGRMRIKMSPAWTVLWEKRLKSISSFFVVVKNLTAIKCH